MLLQCTRASPAAANAPVAQPVDATAADAEKQRLAALLLAAQLQSQQTQCAVVQHMAALQRLQVAAGQQQAEVRVSAWPLCAAHDGNAQKWSQAPA